MPKTITESDVAALVTPADALEAVTRAHLALSSGKSSNIVRVRARLPKFSLHTMSAASPECGMAAVKSYTATPKGVRSLVLLYELESGELLATIEANELGRLRTAAASVVAAKQLLGARSASTLALIGTGYQAEGVVRAYLDHSGLPVTVSVFSRNPESCKAFAQRCGKAFGSEIHAAHSAAEAIQNADIVVSVTTSSQPVVELEWLKEAKHVSALGSNALSRREIPPNVVTAASLIVVDSIDAAKAESGNLLAPIESGRIQWNGIKELGSVIRSGTEAPANGYSIYCSHGLAIQDLFLAATIYQKSGGV